GRTAVIAPQGRTRGDVIELVVLDQEVLGHLARRGIVRPQDINSLRASTDDVVGESYIADDGPRSTALSAPRRENNGDAILAVHPVILKLVVIDAHPFSVLQFQQIFY